MKTPFRFHRASIHPLVGAVAFAVLAPVFSVHAASSTWSSVTSGGLWSDSANWNGSTIADGSGFIADFSKVNITTDVTVHLDSSRTIGGLIFGDTDTSSAASWLLDNNGVSTNVLTLAGTTPTITVNALGGTGVVSISAVIAGSSGLTKAGAGTLTLTGTNTYTGTTTINAGILAVSGGSAIADTSAVVLANVAGATLQLKGSETIASLSGGGASGGNVDLGANTLTVSGTSSTTYSGYISGSGGLVKSGTGTLTLTGSNSYDGVTTVSGSGSTLAISNANALGSSVGNTVVSGTGVNAAQLLISGNINVSEALNISGEGTSYNGALRSTSGTNTWSGAITASGTGNTRIAVNAGVLNITGGITSTSAPVILDAKASGTKISITNTALNLGSNKLLVYDPGIVSLGVAGNTFGVATIGWAGTLQAAMASVISTTAAIEIGNGTGGAASGMFDLNGFDQTIGELRTGASALGQSGTRTVTSASAATLTINQSTTSTYDGSITGALSLVKSGTGTLNLTGSNSYDGVTTVTGSGSVLAISNANALGSSVGNTVVTGTGTNGAQLQVSGNINVAEALHIGGQGAAYAGALYSVSGSNTWSGAITIDGSGARIKVGAGTLNLTGGITSSNGSLTLDASSAGSKISITNTAINLGTRQLYITDPGIVSLGVTGNSFSVATISYSSILQAAMANVLPSTAVIELGNGTGSAASGALDLNGFDQTIGELRTAASSLGQSGTRTVTSASAATLTINQSTTSTYDGSITGALSLVKSGTGTLNLTGSNSYNGVTTVTGSGSVLAISNANALGSSVGNTVVTGTGTNGAQLQVSGNINVAEALHIGGQGAAYGGALYSVSGSNTWSGAITIDGSGTRIKVGAGTLNLTGGITSSNGSLTLDASTVGSKISITNTAINLGSNQLIINDPGVVSLGVTGNSFSVATISYSSTLQAAMANVLPSTAVIEIGNGTGSAASGALDLNGFDQTIGELRTAASSLGQSGTRTVTSASAATLTINQSTTSTFDGVITGALSLVKSGTGTLTLSGTNNYTGGTTINAGGRLALKSSGVLSSSGSVTVNGVFDISQGGAQTIGALTGSGAVNLGGNQLTLTGDSIFSGSINDGGISANSGGSLVKNGTGTLVLTGTNTYTGLTTISAGNLQIGNGGTSGSIDSTSEVTGASGASLFFDRSNAYSLDALISGDIGLQQIGSGTTTLTNYNTYTGATTISNGKLEINGSTSNASAFTVNSGGALGGIGTVGGSVVVQSGGRLAPGNAAFSTGALTLMAGSISDFKLGTASNDHDSAAWSTNNSRVNVNGALVLGGTLNLIDAANAGGMGSVGAGTYLIYSQDGIPTGSFDAINNISGYHAKVATSSSGQVFVDNYQIAAANDVSSTPVNLGITHVGKAFSSSTLSITNTSASNGYAEGLDVTTGTTTGKATVNGSNITNLAGGSTSTNLAVSLSASGTAGIQTGTVILGLASNGSTTSGYSNTTLTSQTVTVTGQVNEYAQALLTKTGGTGDLTSTVTDTLTSYLLDLGTVDASTGRITVNMAMLNSFLSTYQDTLSGTLNVSGLSNFTMTGDTSFSDILSGNSTADWTFSFDTTGKSGRYVETITFALSSDNSTSNTSLTSASLALEIVVVPEPSTWGMVVAGVGMLVGIQRLRRKQANA